MKFRLSFVTNSSDSSFIISKAKITAEQLELIKNHIKVAQKLVGRVEYDLQYCEEGDGWTISETPTQVEGSTYMDNFSMRDFLACIGVKDEDVSWDDQDTRYNESYDWDADEKNTDEDTKMP